MHKKEIWENWQFSWGQFVCSGIRQQTLEDRVYAEKASNLCVHYYGTVFQHTGNLCFLATVCWK